MAALTGLLVSPISWDHHWVWIAPGALVAAHPVIAVDVVASKLEYARSLGATHGVDAAREDPVAAVRRLTRLGADYTFAAVGNARAMISASPDLAAQAKSYEITRKQSPRCVADLPASTLQAEAFAKQLKSHGYRFVGPTSVYAFMQNVGVVNDHVHGCFRATDYL